MRVGLFAAILSLVSCAGPLVRPAATPSRPRHDALLILPGFGYGRGDGGAFRSIAAEAAARGVDVYVAPFLTRTGLATSQDKLRRFIRDERLDRYARLHVFAFIAGAWTLNPIADTLPNLATVVYDRSPFQERAPRIAVRRLPLLAWLRYGSTIFDVARTPYQPLPSARVHVALLIETRPTGFIRGHADDVRGDGPLEFGCAAQRQRYDDCAYLAMDHDELYARFADVWPDLDAFIRTGTFSSSASRTPPARIALTENGR